METLGTALAKIKPRSDGPALPAPLTTNLPVELRPIEPKALAVKLDAALAIYRLPEDWQHRAPSYRLALSDVPPDLVDVALRDVVRTCKWLPQPSELRAPIAKVLEARQRRLAYQERREMDHSAQLAERTNAYNPDAEIRERAMAEIRAIPTPGMRDLSPPVRINSDGAKYRRQLLDQAFRQHVAVQTQSPTPSHTTEDQRDAV